MAAQYPLINGAIGVAIVRYRFANMEYRLVAVSQRPACEYDGTIDLHLTVTHELTQCCGIPKSPDQGIKLRCVSYE